MEDCYKGFYQATGRTRERPGFSCNISKRRTIPTQKKKGGGGGDHADRDSGRLAASGRPHPLPRGSREAGRREVKAAAGAFSQQYPVISSRKLLKYESTENGNPGDEMPGSEMTTNRRKRSRKTAGSPREDTGRHRDQAFICEHSGGEFLDGTHRSLSRRLNVIGGTLRPSLGGARRSRSEVASSNNGLPEP